MASEQVLKDAQAQFSQRLQECARARQLSIDNIQWRLPTQESIAELTVWSQGKAYKYAIYPQELTQPELGHKREELIDLILSDLA
jgi:hypothetical protein